MIPISQRLTRNEKLLLPVAAAAAVEGEEEVEEEGGAVEAETILLPSGRLRSSLVRSRSTSRGLP